MLAEAMVRVTLEVSRFERDLRAKVQQAANRAGRDFDREMKSQMAATGREASKNFGTAARTGMGRAGRDAAKDFDLNFRTGLSQTGGRVAQRLGQGLRVQVSRAGIDAGRGFRDNVAQVLGNAGESTGRAFAGALTNGLTSGATRAGEAAGTRIGAGAVRSASQAGREAGRGFSINFGLGSTGASAPLIAAFAIAGSAILQGLRPASGVLAAMPALLTTLTSSALITVTAFEGVGDAIKAVSEGDIDKINASMARLSPAAQAFVREFASLRPVLRELRSDIQDAFFTEFQGQVRGLAAVFSGPLRSSIVDVSTSTGRLAREFVSAFTDVRGIDNLESSLRGTSRFLDQLAPGLRNLMRGFLDLSGAAAPGLNSLGRAFSSLLTQAGQWMTGVAQSGQALEWVEGSIAGLKELMSTLGDIADVFITVAAAARPLAFALAGVAQVVFALSDAFASLPGPIQTALLAAVLFSRSGLPDVMRRATGEAGPLTTALAGMGNAYRSASERANDFLGSAGGVGRATAALGRTLDTATDSAARFAASVGGGLRTAVGAVDTALSRTSTALQTGFVRATLEADAAVQSTSRSLHTGLIRAGLEAEGALNRVTDAARSTRDAFQTGLIRAGNATESVLNRVTDAAQSTRDTFRSGLIPAALALDAQVTRTQAAMSRFGGALVGRTQNALDSTRDAFGRLNTTMQTGFIRASVEATSAATRFSTALQTGVIRTSIAANTALTAFGSSVRGGVLRPLAEAQTAYQTASAAARDFTSMQGALNDRLGATPSVVGRIRDGFSELSAITQGSGAALRSLASGPVEALSGGLRNIGSTAAGAGAALTRGLGSAVSGLTGALGGPWGLAIAGAGIALSLLSSRQEQARQQAAQHAAAVARLADTLNRQTGAVTATTRELVAKSLAEKNLFDTGRRLGVSNSQLADAFLGQTGAIDTVNSALRNQAKQLIANDADYKRYTNTFGESAGLLDLFTEAALGNRSAMEQLAAKTNDSVGTIDELAASTLSADPALRTLAQSLGLSTEQLVAAQGATRNQAAALSPAQIAALKYADALGVLSDQTADADTKARALNEALQILAGGTIDAEVAQGKFTELLAQLNSELAESTKGLSGMGVALINNEGRINTTTTAGAFLVDTYNSLTEQLSTTATATVEAGRANGDLDGALIKVAQQTQNARNAFVATATQLGLTSAQANQLADAYGLIPSQVVATVSDQGTLQNVQLQVLGVHQRLKDLPPNTPITVRGLTQDAIAKLNEVGVKTESLPDGNFRVTATTTEATSKLQALVSSWGNRVINFVANLVPGNAAGNIVPNAVGRIMAYASGGTHRLNRMSANRAEMVPPNTWRVIGDRARDDEAYIPINSSARSRALLGEAARRMGFALFADGALVGGKGRALGGSVLNVAPGAIVVNAPNADPGLVARATINELARAAVS